MQTHEKSNKKQLRSGNKSQSQINESTEKCEGTFRNIQQSLFNYLPFTLQPHSKQSLPT